jgi:serine/threonine-protein kinase
MRYKNHEESLKEIGATLGVGTLLEGSVRRAGNRVRIVVQLIDAETDAHLWAETYDRELTDIFAIQSDVALQIAAALEAELTADLKSRIEKEPTKDLSAYQLYLKGRHSLAGFTSEGLMQGVELFQQAADRDPAFAHAYAGMAIGYVAIGMGYGAGVLKPEDAYSRAKTAGEKAIEIDNELGEAHAALAFPMFVHDFEWENAEKSYHRALELNPNAADTLDTYGLLLAAQERYEEAIASQRRAQELDPLTPWHTSDLAASLLRAGRYDEALQEAGRAVELEPNFATGHATMAWAYIKQEMYAEGLAELERAASLSPADTVLLGQLGQAYAMAGRVDEARDKLRQLKELSSERYVPPYHMAYVYTGLGEDDKALDALEAAFEERSGGIYGIKGSFLFAPLRSHPRFIALLKRMNL